MSSKTVETILTHMNRNHKISLYDYLDHYAGVKLDIDNPRQNVELVDVKLDKLTLNYTKKGELKSAVVPIHPAMVDFGESRTRLILMAFESADSLGKSPYRILSFVKPDTFINKFSLAFFASLVAVLGANKFIPVVGTHIAALSPRLHTFGKAAFWPTLIIHFIEFIVSTLPVLRFFRAPLRVKLLYLLLTIWVGFPAWTPLKRKAAVLNAHYDDQQKKNKGIKF